MIFKDYKYDALAIIPARAGSKRLKDKNVLKLGDKPLFKYTVDAAINSQCFKKIILSTNDKRIILSMKDCKRVQVENRPDYLCKDDVRALDVVLYHLKKEKEKYEYVALLMPTSPFRNEKHIQQAFKTLMSKKGDSLASVVEYNFHPQLALIIKNKRMYSYFKDHIEWIREDNFPKAYHVNGAIFLSKTKSLLNHKTFIKNGTIAYIMIPEDSIDIDNIFDFKLAEIILTEKQKKHESRNN